VIPIPFSEAESENVGGRVLGCNCEPSLNQATSQCLEDHEDNLASQKSRTRSRSEACLPAFLALSASKSNTLLRRMRAIFDEIEDSMDTPKLSTLKAFVDKVAGEAVLKRYWQK
jgi:hypothetical protein